MGRARRRAAARRRYLEGGGNGFFAAERHSLSSLIDPPRHADPVPAPPFQHPALRRATPWSQPGRGVPRRRGPARRQKGGKQGQRASRRGPTCFLFFSLSPRATPADPRPGPGGPALRKSWCWPWCVRLAGCVRVCCQRRGVEPCGGVPPHSGERAAAAHPLSPGGKNLSSPTSLLMSGGGGGGKKRHYTNQNMLRGGGEAPTADRERACVRTRELGGGQKGGG